MFISELGDVKSSTDSDAPVSNNDPNFNPIDDLEGGSHEGRNEGDDIVVYNVMTKPVEEKRIRRPLCLMEDNQI